jgi:hypothetical protein
MNTDDLREQYGKHPTKYNTLIDDDIWTDDYVLWLEERLLIYYNNTQVINNSCGFFEPDENTSSKTICKHCGIEKFLHNTHY